MDIISLNEAATANGRIEKFNANPDSNSGVLTQPKVIEAGETVTIKSGRQAILADTVIDGDLIIEAGGDVFVPAGATFGDLEYQIALKADSASPTLTDATIELAATTWSNPDGVEYFDDGLLGVPDTSFSSTGARLYPDGTIRGKSSYGEYVKYPDGLILYFKSEAYTFSQTLDWGGKGMIISDAIVLGLLPIVSTIGVKTKCSSVGQFGGYLESIGTETNYGKIRLLSAFSSSSITILVQVTAIGEWK